MENNICELCGGRGILIVESYSPHHDGMQQEEVICEYCQPSDEDKFSDMSGATEGDR